MAWKIPVCDGCQRENPIAIMLKDELWKTISPFPDRKHSTGILCVQCIQTRLDRKITLNDLKPCGMTDQMLLGYLIGSGQTTTFGIGFPTNS